MTTKPQQILIFDKPEQANVWHFQLKMNYIKRLRPAFNWLISAPQAWLGTSSYSSLAWIRPAICLLALALIGACEPWNQTLNPYSINTTHRFGAGLGRQLTGCCNIRSPTVCPQCSAIGWPSYSQFQTSPEFSSQPVVFILLMSPSAVSSLKTFTKIMYH